MKTYALMTASVLALGLAACGPPTPTVRAALDCPATEGDLTRTAAAADGRSCTYKTSGGADVSLQLVATPGGNANAALQVIETRLLAEQVAKPAEGGPAASAKAATPADRIAAEVEADVRAAMAEAVRDASAGAVASGKADGIVIGEDDHGTAHINLPGIHIVANEKDETANVKIGPLSVKAGGDAATVRINRSVRLRGEALRREKRGMRAMFIYAGKDLPSGYRFVGYEAGGPKAGPLTVAIVKSRVEEPDDGEIYPDVQRLVRRNAGV